MENNINDSGHVTCGDDHEADVVDEGEPALQQLSANPRIKILLKKTVIVHLKDLSNNFRKLLQSITRILIIYIYMNYYAGPWDYVENL